MKKRLAASYSAAAVRATVESQGPVRDAQLEGGLEYSVVYRDTVPLVSLVVGVRAGARCELVDERGAAHLVPRLVLRQTWEGQEVRQHLAAVGAGCRLHWEADAAYFEIATPSASLPMVLDTLRRAIFEFSPPEAERLEEERAQGLHACRESLGRDQGLAARLRRELYGDEGYGADPLGGLVDLRSASAVMLERFYRRTYQRSSVFLALVGAVTEEVESHLTAWDRPDVTVTVPTLGSTPPARPPSDPVLEIGGHPSPIWIALQALPGSLSAEAAAIDILLEILMERSRGRLRRALARAPGALEPIEWSREVHRDASWWQLSVPFEGRNLARLRSTFEEHLGKVSQVMLASDEIDRARERVQRQLGSGLRHGRDVASALARTLAVGGADAATFRSVDADRIAVAASGLALNRRRVFGALLPQQLGEVTLDWGANRSETQHRERGAGGLTLLVRQGRSTSECALGILVGGGGSLDPRGKSGLANVTAELCMRGRRGESSAAFREQKEQLGAELEVVAYPDGIAFQIVGAVDRRRELTALLAGGIVEPSLVESELELVKQVQVSRIERLGDDRWRRARRELARSLYGSEPGFGVPVEGTASSIASIGLEDVRDHYERAYQRDNIQVLLRTGEDLERALEELETAFRHVPIGEPIVLEAPRLRSAPSRVVPLDEPADSGVVGLAFSCIVGRAEGHVRGVLLAQCLGASVPARLGYLLRRHPEIRRVESRWHALRGAGVLEILADVDPEQLEACEARLRAEIRELLARPLESSEVEPARGLVTTAWLARSETIASAHRQTLDGIRLGLGLEATERFLDAAAVVSADELLTFTHRLLEEGAEASVMLKPLSNARG